MNINKGNGVEIYNECRICLPVSERNIFYPDHLLCRCHRDPGDVIRIVIYRNMTRKNPWVIVEYRVCIVWIYGD